MIYTYSFNLLFLTCISALTPTSSFSGGWVDPDTSVTDSSRVSYTDGKVYDVIMSDEFNVEGESIRWVYVCMYKYPCIYMYIFKCVYLSRYI